MAKEPDEMASDLISIYKSKRKETRKGYFSLTVCDFKLIAGKEKLKAAYLNSVDSYLREDGYIIINLRDERDLIAIMRIETVKKIFNKPDEQLLLKYIPNEDEDEW